MEPLLAFRLLKHVGSALFVAGVLGALLPERLVDRQRATYWVATPGLLLSWTAGYGLVRETGVSLGATWISVSMLLSLGVLQLAVWSVERDGRRSVWSGVLAAAGILAILALMVWRPDAR